MGERSRTRAIVVSRALRLRVFGRAARGGEVRRVLVAHNLLLGDTLMLTGLLAKLRMLHPAASISLLAAPAVAPLYSGRPYGVEARAFTPHDSATARKLVDETPGFDLAIIPGDNRYSWLAAAMGAGKMVAHAGDPKPSSSWLIDDLRPYPPQPATWTDMIADLVDGPDPPPYEPGDWPPPAFASFETPRPPYAVIHVGASSALKRWPPERWMQLASHLEGRGLAVAWSAGRGEEAIVKASDPEGRFVSFAGRLDLPQMAHLLAGAAVLASPDTGIAHLGRVAGTPTAVLFGPGSAPLCSNGRFWRHAKWRGLTIEPFECRDQHFLFGREVDWVRRCARTLDQCPHPRCLDAIEVPMVTAAIDELLGSGPRP